MLSYLLIHNFTKIPAAGFELFHALARTDGRAQECKSTTGVLISP